ncbi:hypothetical protein [Methylobacterium sp. SD21]|uniref:hypothetical protein n=1 Tax=Methylobacterium litchii TaxID=3138810 RepID=UPI00313BAF0B
MLREEDMRLPQIRQITTPDGQPPAYCVVRYIPSDEGKWLTEALSTAGEWVQRPEGFVFDPDVILFG